MKLNQFIKRVKQSVRRRIKRLFYKKDETFNNCHRHLLRDAANGAGSIVVFDVGAHRGESIRRFRGVFPDAVIHSFEPDHENFQSLQNGFPDKGNLHMNNFALGAQAEKRVFHHNAKSDTSSFIPVDPNSVWVEARSRQYEVDKDKFTQQSYEAEIRTLDEYVKENGIGRINLLKMDTQGFEDEVLKGARKALEGRIIDVIETELICAGIYSKTLSFYDIEQFLAPCGYRLYAVDKPSSLVTGKGMISLNLIYARDGLG